jgi:molybdopterin/thiamine biosynthesis adenylyltransferase
MNHVRHSNIYSIPGYFQVGLVGAGGLGATTALTLAKMGVQQMTVWDGDVVSEENIATQLHKWRDVGVPKVFALQQTLEEFSDEIIFDPRPERVNETSAFPRFNLLISAVDSIMARKLIWDAIYRGVKPGFYCDMRMAAEEFQVFVLDMNDKNAVHKYAYMLESLSDDDVPELTCTEKATFHCSLAAAGHIGAILRNIVRREQKSARIVHYIPRFQVLTFNL